MDQKQPVSTLRLNRKSSRTAVEPDEPLVSFRASPTGPKCPFGNPEEVSFQLLPGGCVWLGGPSGAGKTTLSTYLAGLSTQTNLQDVNHITASCDWNPKIPPGERCGVLFQQTTLLDALTVAGNVSVALLSCPSSAGKYDTDTDALTRKIKQLLDAVGLDYARDAAKRPTQLSGGMARRASLALQLAQRKRVIVLDEPFAGLDLDAATSVAKELWQLRHTIGTALLLISHEPELVQLVMKAHDHSNNNNNNHESDSKDNSQKPNHTAIVTLTPPTNTGPDEPSQTTTSNSSLLFGITFWDRFVEKLWDYVVYSLPLIVLTFVACGLAIAMLSADILQRIDVTEKVLSIVDQEIRPLIAMVTGEEEANPMYLMVAKMKVRGMLNDTIPTAKANLYAIGMAKLFVLEIGPLLTALLLCGRIGGSYAGIVATMQATSQTKLLRTLGMDPQQWTFCPAMTAAVLASPVLTVTGTWIALVLGGMVGPRYGIGTFDFYREEVRKAVFPDLQIQQAWEKSWLAVLVEVTTYPPIFHIWKAATFIIIVLVVAEGVARLQPNLTPRGVPGVITSSVVGASLVVILADWAFSQWLILRV